MAHPKAMGIGAMFVLLILAVVLLPMIVRYIGKSDPYYAMGFENPASDVMYTVPSVVASTDSLDYTPDPNTKYLCRSPNKSGIPCDEGSFCDGTTNTCVKQFPHSDIDLTHGYYS